MKLEIDIKYNLEMLRKKFESPARIELSTFQIPSRFTFQPNKTECIRTQSLARFEYTNRPSTSSENSPFQNEAKRKILSCKNGFYLHENN